MALIRRNYIAGGDNYGVDVWGIIAPSSGTNVAIVASYPSGGAFMALVAARYSGVSSATALASSCNGASCNAIASSSTSYQAQSITIAQSALLIAAGTQYDGGPQNHTPASGWAERLDGSGTPLTSAQFLFDRNVSLGTYGGATAFSTTASADTYISILMAFPLA